MRDQNLTCIGCPLGCSISVSLSDNGEVSEIHVRREKNMQGRRLQIRRESLHQS